VLEDYSHIRHDAKRTALDALSPRGTKSGYDSKDGTKLFKADERDSHVIDGREGNRTLGLFFASNVKSKLRLGAAIS
jgi:hypothetical protein